MKDLGVAYGMTGKAQDAVNLFEKALQVDPNDAQLFFNLSISYRMIGKTAEADKALAKSNELRQKESK